MSSIVSLRDKTPPSNGDERRNHSLREDIIAYWSDRAESFDQSFGHGIAPGAEWAAWSRLIATAIGPAPQKVLELACGTGEITGVLLGLGYEVKALDFAEPMLARAKEKHAHHPNVSFRLGDAENTMEPETSFDAVISRHLVWTLLQPEKTLHDWLRVLKPGGTLVVLDGNWTEPSLFGRICQPMVKLIDVLSPQISSLSSEMMARHAAIRSQLPLGAGLTRETLNQLLVAAGFTDIETISPRPIIRAQTEVGTLRDAIWARSFNHVFVRACRPPHFSRSTR